MAVRKTKVRANNHNKTRYEEGKEFEEAEETKIGCKNI
jgi:hypothetical protein